MDNTLKWVKWVCVRINNIKLYGNNPYHMAQQNIFCLATQ